MDSLAEASKNINDPVVKDISNKFANDLTKLMINSADLLHLGTKLPARIAMSVIMCEIAIVLGTGIHSIADTKPTLKILETIMQTNLRKTIEMWEKKSPLSD